MIEILTSLGRSDGPRLRNRAGFAILALGFLVVFINFGFEAAVAAEQEPKARQIRIASEGARPPFNYLDADNQLAGFEIDLVRELCRRMEAECTFVAQDWESLTPGLIANQYDAVIAAIEITDEQRQRIAFSKPYAHLPSALVAQQKSPVVSADPSILAGLQIGVKADSPQQAYVEDKYKGSEIKTYATLEEAMLDLAEGRIDVVADDKLVAAEFLATRREGRCCRLVADLPRDETYFGAGLAIGFRKNDNELRAAFDKALDAVLEDESFTKIRAKYFDFDIR